MNIKNLMSFEEYQRLAEMNPLTRKATMTFKYDQEFGWNQVDTSEMVNIFESGIKEALEQCAGNGFVSDYLFNTCFYNNLSYSLADQNGATEFLYRAMVAAENDIEFKGAVMEKGVLDSLSKAQWPDFSTLPSNFAQIIEHYSSHLVEHYDLLMGVLDAVILIIGGLL